MATTLMPLDPATTPQHAIRLLPIAADLLPAEITVARTARRVRGRVLALLGVLLVLLGGWYAFAVVQRAAAKDALDSANADKAILEARQEEYATVVTTQRESKLISDRLAVLLKNDLRWAGVLTTLRDTAGGAGVTVTGMSGTLTGAAGAPAAAAEPRLPGTSSKVVGTLTVTGTARDKPAVAYYVEALVKHDQFANAMITSVTTGNEGAQFSLQVDLTEKALGGRYTKKGGK